MPGNDNAYINIDSDASSFFCGLVVRVLLKPPPGQVDLKLYIPNYKMYLLKVCILNTDKHSGHSTELELYGPRPLN